ncbi:MAG: hypothetical protein WCA46_05330, partial [Actinocatenispora sp.]
GAPDRAPVPDGGPDGTARPTEGGPADGTVTGVRLPSGLVLLLPPGSPPLTHADQAAVRAAAQPLVDMLIQRGLMETAEFGGAR